MDITLSDDRYEEIKRIIVNLFMRYHIKCIPVNGFELATKMGVTVIPYSAIAEEKRYLLLKKSEDGSVWKKVQASGIFSTTINKITAESTTLFFMK